MGGLQAIICYHVAVFRDFLEFDMQHDHVLKKFNFGLLTPSPGSGGRVGEGDFCGAKYLLPCCCIS